MTPLAVQIAVVGGGVAGLAAAGEAHTAGARTLLIEERPVLGGRAVIVPGARGLAEGLMRDLRSTEVWRGSPVWGLFGRTLAVLHGGRTEVVRADAVILATGAAEQMMPFPGWTLDGVMTLEAGWEAFRAGRIGPSNAPVVLDAGGEGGALANRLSERGIAVLLVAPERPRGLSQKIAWASGSRVAAAQGSGAVDRVVLTDGGEHECRTLCVESLRAPLTDLIRLAGGPCVYQPRLGGFIPRYDRAMVLHAPAARLLVGGDAAGVDAPRAAAESGRLAARCALQALDLLPDAEAKVEESRQRLRAASVPLVARAREALMIGTMPDDVVARWEGPPHTIICRCEGVTAGALQAAVDDGARSPDELGRWTRCGMGTCQWHWCELPVMQWLSGVLDVPVGRLPLPRLHAPVRPVPVSALADSELSAGKPASLAP